MHSRCNSCNPLDSETGRLDSAVEAGEFGAIPELAASYRKALVLALARTPDWTERRRLLREGQEKLNGSLQLVKARRAHLAARQSSAAAHAAAFDLPQRALHTWQIEG